MTPPMADISGSFAATGSSDTFNLSSVARTSFDSQFAVYLKPASFVGTVVLERSINGTDWYPINAAGATLYQWTFTSGTGNISETGQAVEAREVYRLRCSAFTSGSLAYLLSSAE